MTTPCRLIERSHRSKNPHPPTLRIRRPHPLLPRHRGTAARVRGARLSQPASLAPAAALPHQASALRAPACRCARWPRQSPAADRGGCASAQHGLRSRDRRVEPARRTNGTADRPGDDAMANGIATASARRAKRRRVIGAYSSSSPSSSSPPRLRFSFSRRVWSSQDSWLSNSGSGRSPSGSHSGISKRGISETTSICLADC
jgi:hypothetical protein